MALLKAYFSEKLNITEYFVKYTPSESPVIFAHAVKALLITMILMMIIKIKIKDI